MDGWLPTLLKYAFRVLQIKVSSINPWAEQAEPSQTPAQLGLILTETEQDFLCLGETDTTAYSPPRLNRDRAAGIPRRDRAASP